MPIIQLSAAELKQVINEVSRIEKRAQEKLNAAAREIAERSSAKPASQNKPKQ